MKIVTPKWMSGRNMSWNLNLLSGPKFTIICGECGLTFSKRLELVDYPCVACPFCGTVNRLPLVTNR